MKKKASGGGKAEAAGGNYETLVVTWYARTVLLGAAAQPEFDLPADTRLVRFNCQSDAPVDDVNAITSDDGLLFVQAKRRVGLSARASSAYAKALDQFVRQVAACVARDLNHTWSRPLNPDRDRLILATQGTSSKRITETLPELLRRVRDLDDSRSLVQVAVTEVEKSVARVTETVLKRRWKAVFGRASTKDDINGLLRLIWIQQLDLESGGRDRRQLLEQFRTHLLERPAQAGVAFSELFRLAGRLRAERSGSDRPTLLRVLSGAGVAITALPDFRADVAALKRWTASRLQAAPRFTRLLADDPKLVIERAAWPAFYAASVTDALLLVGDPGAGKSGFAYRLAESSQSDGHDVIFLPVDILNVDSIAALKAELLTTHELPEILENWPGSKPGLLILDALDAARKPETQRFFREVVARALGLAGSRWKVVASIRKYDLRQGLEWAGMFRGNPPHAGFAEFSRVRHIAIGALSSEEISQTASAFPALAELYAQASDKLRDLLQNIFNLHLLAELLRDGVAKADLSVITTQSELLDRYWRHRIRREVGRHDAREAALTVIVERMVGNQELRVRRDDVRSQLDAEALVDLERHGILRADEQGARPDEDMLLFSHHVLFDYAVARLMFHRGRQPQRLVSLLRSRRELPVMLAPSLSMALAEAWTFDRSSFWSVALLIAQSADLQGVAQLAAPMVIAEQVREIVDLDPLFNSLSGSAETKSAAEAVAQNLVGALFVRQRAGIPLIGPAAGPWMVLAERLAATASDRMMRTAHSLVAQAVQKL